MLILKARTIILLFLSIFYTATGITQTPHREQYSPNLDSLWSNGTFILKMSKDGNWVALGEDFPEKGREIVVVQTNGITQFRFPEAEFLDFSADSKWFGCISKKGLIIIDLKSHEESRYSNIAAYAFSSDGNYIAAHQQGNEDINNLLIINLITKNIEKRLNSVTQFKWHPSRNILITKVEEEEKVQVVQFDVENGNTKTLFEDKGVTIDHLGWNNFGTAVVFLSGKEGGNQLNYYDENQGILKTLADIQIHEKFKKFKLSNREPFVSDDGKKVIFYLQGDDIEKVLKNDVQIWDSDDPWIEPQMERYRKQVEQYFLTAWYPESGAIRAIETEGLHTAAMSVNHDFALVYDQLQYEPLYKFYPNADLYIKNIKTGDSTLVCKNQYTEGEFITISPKGKYISYFKDSDWWVYTIETGKNINLTKGLEGTFKNTEPQRPGDAFPYGNPGWLEDEKYIILYDQYDIWIMTPDGETKKRVTKGKEENFRYRINRDFVQKGYNPLTINREFGCESFDFNKGIVLELFDLKTYKSGIAIWQKNKEIKPLLMVEGKIEGITSLENLEVLVYNSQRFDRPISFNRTDVKQKKTNLIYQTNKKLMNYDLGTAEFIEYELKDGTELRGSLVYPSNYNPDKKYPIIVEIYERESSDINNFTPPSNLMLDGFNLLKFTMNDYFVLYPDIDYTIGEPGISALKSVEAAVAKVLETGKVDGKRIGLIGHSYGGYETAFIVTQTDMFAAAVAGAAVTDMVTYYHDINWAWKQSQMWRIENQQFRFGDSFFNMKEAYYRNSPFNHVENMNTPLLLWTGNTDTNINWHQSIQMFMALKRLGKKAKLLVYKGDDHNLFKTKNQNHLSRTIFEWMETYVKGKSKLEREDER